VIRDAPCCIAGCGPAGEAEAVALGRGLEAFRRSFAEGVPELADRAAEIQVCDQVKLLTVRADRLLRWYRPGLPCIGDTAHAMSPIAGVGINVAIPQSRRISQEAPRLAA
jgi:hypothetical protein